MPIGRGGRGVLDTVLTALKYYEGSLIPGSYPAWEYEKVTFWRLFKTNFGEFNFSITKETF